MENRKLFQKVEILCECCGKNLLGKYEVFRWNRGGLIYGIECKT